MRSPVNAVAGDANDFLKASSLKIDAKTGDAALAALDQIRDDVSRMAARVRNVRAQLVPHITSRPPKRARLAEHATEAFWRAKSCEKCRESTKALSRYDGLARIVAVRREACHDWQKLLLNGLQKGFITREFTTTHVCVERVDEHIDAGREQVGLCGMIQGREDRHGFCPILAVQEHDERKLSSFRRRARAINPNTATVTQPSAVPFH